MRVLEFIGASFAALLLLVALAILFVLALAVEATPIVLGLVLALLIARWWGLL